MWKIRYMRTAASLLLLRRISFRTFRRALRDWPIAVAGSHGAYILDPDGIG